ncbi:hypothetical protein Hanom_Chr04g00299771 [Helianthus anomalus]
MLELWINKNKSKLQVPSFIFTSNFRRCPLSLKLMSFVLNVSKFCMLRSFVPNSVNFTC